MGYEVIKRVNQIFCVFYGDENPFFLIQTLVNHMPYIGIGVYGLSKQIHLYPLLIIALFEKYQIGDKRFKLVKYGIFQFFYMYGAGEMQCKDQAGNFLRCEKGLIQLVFRRNENSAIPACFGINRNPHRGKDIDIPDGGLPADFKAFLQIAIGRFFYIKKIQQDFYLSASHDTPPKILVGAAETSSYH